MKYLRGLLLVLILFLVGCEVEPEIEEENTPPTIEFEFDDFLPVTLGEPVFFNTWVFGDDAEDGKLPCEWDFEGVDLETPGSYTATCTVEDADGDTESADVDIEVEDQTPPVVQKLESHIDEYLVGTTVDFLSNIMIYDNYDTVLDIDVDVSEVDSNTEGTYTVTYTVTDGSENVTTLLVPYTFVSYTTPIFTEDITTGHDYLLIDYSVTDPDSLFVRLDVSVEKEGEPFMVDSFFDIEYEIEIPVPADKEFKVTLTYVYGDGVSEAEWRRIKEEEIMSDSWEIPEFNLDLDSYSDESVTLDVVLLDPDSRIIESYLNVYDGDSGLFEESDIVQVFPNLVPGPITIQGLLPNHEYRFEVVYTYDLDDEEGIQETRKYLDVLTAGAEPIPLVSNHEYHTDRVVFELEIYNFEYITSPEVTVILYSDDTESYVIASQTYDPAVLNIIDLVCTSVDSDHWVVIRFDYNLNDGNGVQAYEMSFETYTTDIEILNFIAISVPALVGEPLMFELEIHNPAEYNIDGITIEGIPFELSVSKVNDTTYTFTIPGEYIVQGTNVYTITSIGYLGMIANPNPELIFVELSFPFVPSVTLRVMPPV